MGGHINIFESFLSVDLESLDANFSGKWKYS